MPAMTEAGQTNQRSGPCVSATGLPSGPRRGPLGSTKSKAGHALAPSFLFLVPALVVYLFVIIYPTLDTIYYSLTNWSVLEGPAKFVGLANYETALSSGGFQAAILHTLVFAVSLTVGDNLLGLGLALALKRRSRVNYLARLAWFVPAVLPTIATAYLWKFIYSPLGPIAQLWRDIFHSVAPGFLASPSQAIWSIVAIVIWQGAGYSMIIYLAGLETIPNEQLEAALIDGASSSKRVRYVLVPQLWGAAVVSTTLALIPGLMLFTRVLATTGGGPGYATQTVSLLVYNEAFAYSSFGYGMALAVLLLIGIALIGGVEIALLSWRASRVEGVSYQH